MFVSLSFAACEGTTKSAGVVDTEGRHFRVECEKSQCHVERADAPPVSPDKSHAKLDTSGRVVGICDTQRGGSAEAGDCRALVCRKDPDCPPLHGLDAGHCINGLCVSPENPLSTSDAVLLCLAGTGLGRGAPKQVERYAMALNCGSPCKIPAPCRQP